MKKEKIERICANCEQSTPVGDTDACICAKRGLVKARGVCGDFKTDLLKVVPEPPVPLDDIKMQEA